MKNTHSIKWMKSYKGFFYILTKESTFDKVWGSDDEIDFGSVEL